jgi:F0F1-type ATP synthase assembly protein I
MTNPMSFCWANEIWGYGFLGVATWHMSGYYSGKNNTIRTLLIANGVVSIATVLFTIIDMNWLMTAVGLTAYFVWNILMITLMILIFNYTRKLNSKAA